MQLLSNKTHREQHWKCLKHGLLNNKIRFETNWQNKGGTTKGLCQRNTILTESTNCSQRMNSSQACLKANTKNNTPYSLCLNWSKLLAQEDGLND